MTGFSKWYLSEIEVLVSGKFQPERKPPFCMDHDSLNFSDPGDPAEVDDVRVCLHKNGKQLDITEWLSDELYSDICDDILIQMQEEL